MYHGTQGSRNVRFFNRFLPLKRHMKTFIIEKNDRYRGIKQKRFGWKNWLLTGKSNAFIPIETTLCSIIDRWLPHKSIHISTLKQCFWQESTWKTSTKDASFHITFWLINTYKTSSCLAYLQQQIVLLANTPSTEMLVVKKIHYTRATDSVCIHVCMRDSKKGVTRWNEKRLCDTNQK